MGKILIISILGALLPIIASAQAAGGKVKRPDNHNIYETPKNKRKTTKQGKQQQKGFSEILQPVKKINNAIIQRLINNMVYVEGGTFEMGATREQGCETYIEEKPVHNVSVYSFFIGKYEVTQEEWQTIMGKNPSKFKGSKRPVESVSWTHCQSFIQKLNKLTGNNFRLLTEAEWEYAARGGCKSKGYKYSGSNDLKDVGWYSDNSNKTTHNVGQKLPNELGLYDMSGNVWEWCADWMDNYSNITQTNPKGPGSGSYRVNRGGCSRNYAKNCRVSYRSKFLPNDSRSSLGLRLAH